MENSWVEIVFTEPWNNRFANMELVELVEKARDLSLEPIDDGEKPEDVVVKKLNLDERRFAPLSQHVTLWLDFWLFWFSELHIRWHVRLLNQQVRGNPWRYFTETAYLYEKKQRYSP